MNATRAVGLTPLAHPNWMIRLPGFSYRGDVADGYMTAREVANLLVTYRRSFAAPVGTGVAVTRITSDQDRHNHRDLRGPVAGTGRRDGERCMQQTARSNHRRRSARPHQADHPDRLSQPRPDRGPTGAGRRRLRVRTPDRRRIRSAGRDVTLGVGDHVRLSRTDRGMDIHWWMDTIGQLDAR
jgi:putative flavoprotein involved in K+ transport